MKIKQLVLSFVGLFLISFLAGCATLSTQQPPDLTCSNQNTTSMLKSGEYQKKVDNFLVIQDASSSMGEKVDKSSANYSKLDLSKDLIMCLNNTLPDAFDVNAGLRGFGPFYSKNGLVYGMTQYSQNEFGTAVSSIGSTGGVTPIANSLIYGANDLLDTPGLKDIPGKTAVILISDGVNTVGDDPVSAAGALKESYGNNICIYTILIGNDPKGRVTMQQIADASGCGFAVEGGDINNVQGMNKFVTDVFLAKAPKKLPPPVVKKKAPVMKKPVEKISITLLIEFDFDKDVVRSQHHDDIKKIADTLRKYTGANAVLEGHADSIGTDSYNMDLSKRRAESVKKYLIENFNIDASRISTAWFGETKPATTNDTDSGRQRNRRVVAVIE